jgi:hypothetical protein
MNPQFRKVALIAAALGLLLSLFLALRPDGDEEATTTIGATTTQPTTGGTTTEAPPATTEPEPATTAEPTGTVEFRIVAGGAIERGKVRTGRKVRIVATAEVEDEVHLHGYDLSAEVTPGKGAEIEFEATIPGQFQIELENRHQLIGVLEVGP